MSQTLYRKWRPQTFAALKGQDAIRDTLFYALTHGQMSQAYLFCGPRGTGKTTTARLIAKLVNCTADGKSDKPCNECEACRTITEGSNLDILELDAASNRGIDEIRQLRDTVRFSPTQAQFKVFIIDEVHMLTREAFNALLKTLEEPPSYALFILATTEVHKIPPTILSRCQRYDFRLATQEGLMNHLLAVAKDEGMNLAPDAAQFLARLADGSYRDALTLLEQVKASHQKEFTLQTVEGLFGYVPQDQVVDCLAAILTGDVAAAHQSIDAVLARGADLRAFCDQLLYWSQQAMEARAMGDLKALPASLAKVVKATDLKRLVTWLESLLEAIQQSKQSPIARLPLDLAIAKSGLLVSSSLVTSQPVNQPTSQLVTSQPASKTIETSVTVTETVTVPVATQLPQAIEPEDWAKILTELKGEAPSLITTLTHAKILGLQGDILTLGVKYKMHADVLNRPAKRAQIEQVMAQVLGVPLKMSAQVVKDLDEADETVDLAEIFEFDDNEDAPS